MLVSIIIPVYNVQNYVRATLDCVINQSYKEIEVIIVDDGSTDESGKICDEIASFDQRLKVYHNQNGGVSKARNFGLAKSHGRYFTFIDSDDLIEDNYIHDLVKVMEQYNVGVVRPIWKKNGKVFDYNLRYDENGVCLIDKKNFNSMRFCNSIWGLYDKKIISGLVFREDIYLCEDTLFNFSAFFKAGKMALTNQTYYNYIVRNDSVCNQKIGPKHLTICKAYKVMYSLVGEDYSLKNVIEKFEFDTLMIIHRQFILGGTYKDYLSKFRNIRERIISLKQKWLKKERFLTKLLEHVFLYCPAKIALFCNEIKTYLVKK